MRYFIPPLVIGHIGHRPWSFILFEPMAVEPVAEEPASTLYFWGPVEE